jgi:hypothetical protein
MTNIELERILKSAKVPVRPDTFWENFPQHVVAGLRRTRSDARAEAGRWQLARAWAISAAAVCLILVFAVVHWRGRDRAAGSAGLLQDERAVREIIALFPRQLRALVQNEQGLTLVLSEREDVPESPPLYVRVCRGQKCSSFVTFSGQQLQIGGEQMTVLADGRGDVMLVGNNFFWSRTMSLLPGSDLRVQAWTMTSPL